MSIVWLIVDVEHGQRVIGGNVGQFVMLLRQIMAFMMRNPCKQINIDIIISIIKYKIKKMSDRKQARKQTIAKAKLSISKLSIISRNVNMVNEKINSISSSSPEMDDGQSVSCMLQSNNQVRALDNIDTFHQKYKLGKKIGEGSSGVVWECLHLRRNKIYACKTIMFDDQHVPLLKKSFKDVRQLQNTSIVKYKALYLDLEKHLAYLVMQHVQLPSLMKYISNMHIVVQNDVKWIFVELFRTLRYMHSKGVCHRDIKPDNIMINEEEKKIKIIDFGISKKMIVRKQKIDMLTITGTLFYRAPEMFIGGGYNQKVDIWAAGITLYQILFGKTPFASEYHSETIENIQTLDIDKDIHNDEKDNFSQIAMDLIYRLLKKCPKQRFSAQEALQHLWFEKKSFKVHQRYSDIGHVIETEYSKCKKVVQEYDPNMLKNCQKLSSIRNMQSPTYHRLEVDDF